MDPTLWIVPSVTIGLYFVFRETNTFQRVIAPSIIG